MTSQKYPLYVCCHCEQYFRANAEGSLCVGTNLPGFDKDGVLDICPLCAPEFKRQLGLK